MDIIRRTPFTSKAAEAFFQYKINGDDFGGDVSFKSTMRALLADRIGDDIIHLSFDRVALSCSRQSVYSDGELIDLLKMKCDMAAMLCVCSLDSSDPAGNDRLFNLAEQHFADGVNWVKLEAVTVFYKRYFDVLAFVCEEQKKSFILVKNMTHATMQLLQAAVLVYFPWYFRVSEGDKPNDDELALINAILAKSTNDYMDAINRIAAKHDFQSEYTKSVLTDIETSYEKNRLEDVRLEIESIMATIERLQRDIGSQMEEMYKRNIELDGLELKIAKNNGESLISDYFLANKRLCLDDSRQNTIFFHVCDYITYYDPEIVQRCIDNESSFVYGSAPNNEIARKLATAIFIDEKIRIRTCAGYSLSMGGSFKAIQGYGMFNGDVLSHIPNTHIEKYGCLGNYAYSINERMVERDFIGVLEQATASAKSLSFADSVVMRSFFADLYRGVGGKCFELSDGRTMDINEVIGYLSETEEKGEETHE